MVYVPYTPHWYTVPKEIIMTNATSAVIRTAIAATYTQLMHEAMFSMDDKRAVVDYALNDVLGLDIPVDATFTMVELHNINEFVTDMTDPCAHCNPENGNLPDGVSDCSFCEYGDGAAL